MSTLLKINVVNGQESQNTFFFFQQPAVYAGGATVYSNSIYSRTLGPASQGAQITFQSNFQYYAVVQEAATATPVVGVSSGYESAIQQIDITAEGNTPQHANSTVMSWSEKVLGLSKPVNVATVQPGAFRITTAKFTSSPDYFNVGSGCTVDGSIVLSNFVVALPQRDVDCQPVLKFYVQIGSYLPGVVMNFTESSVNTAVCDFTGGYTTANVTYKADGDWDVHMS